MIKLYLKRGLPDQSGMGDKVRFYYPMPGFPSVSVTGASCGLNCAHCGGHYLGHMTDVSTPEKLKDYCNKLWMNNGVGLLLSGGSTREGKVPLRPLLGAVRWVKDNTGLIVNTHTGVLSRVEAEEIAAAGVDIASVDLVGSRETVKRVYGLDIKPEEYMQTLINLHDAGVPQVAPHVTVGLDYGVVKGEFKALEYAGAVNPEVIVVNALIPTKGTLMEKVPAPSHGMVLDVIRESKRLHPDVEVSIGCMRPRVDKPSLEWQAIKAGASRLATPSRSTFIKATREGINVKVINGCCATPISYEKKYPRLTEKRRAGFS